MLSPKRRPYKLPHGANASSHLQRISETSAHRTESIVGALQVLFNDVTSVSDGVATTSWTTCPCFYDVGSEKMNKEGRVRKVSYACLLYTSDAADE